MTEPASAPRTPETPDEPPGAEAPPARALDERPLLTVRQPERMGRVGVRAVASALVVIALGALVTALVGLVESAGRGGLPTRTFADLPFAASVTGAFAVATLAYFLLEGIAHQGWANQAARVILCVVAGLAGPLAGLITFQVAAHGVVPVLDPTSAFDVIGRTVAPLARPHVAAVVLLPTVALACLAAARSPVHRHPGEYGVVDGTWLAARWGTPAALPLLVVLGIEEPIGALIALLLLVPMVASTAWAVGVAVSFVDMLGVMVADAISPQERAYRRGDMALDQAGRYTK